MLSKLNDDVYLYPGRTNILFIKSQGIMIDTGINEDASRKALREAQSNNIDVKLVLNTHHHIDHVGGNFHVVKKTNASVVMTRIEKLLIQNALIASFLDLGLPITDEGFLSYNIQNLEDTDLPRNIRVLDLSGHSPGMIGFLHDNVVFTSDLFFTRDVLSKYVVPYHLDVEKALMKLDEMKSLIKNNQYVVPSHGPVMDSSLALDIVEVNIKQILFVKSMIMETLSSKQDWIYNEFVKKIMELLQIKRESLEQFLLNKRAIESYLGWLYRENAISFEIRDDNIVINVKKF